MKTAMFFYGGLWLAGCAVATSGLALLWGYPEVFGGWEVGRFKVFAPLQHLLWYGVTHPGDHWALHLAGLLCLAFGALCGWRAWRECSGGDADGVHGRDRLQETDDDLRKSGLL